MAVFIILIIGIANSPEMVISFQVSNKIHICVPHSVKTRTVYYQFQDFCKNWSINWVIVVRIVKIIKYIRLSKCNAMIFIQVDYIGGWMDGYNSPTKQ